MVNTTGPMDHIRNIRLIALKDAMLEPSHDAQWRHCARWYSKTFSTPLHMVDDLPRLDVLQAYFEEHYEVMEEVELHKELEELLRPQDALQKSLEKSKEESDLDRMVREAAEANKAVKAKPGVPAKPKDIGKSIDEAVADLGKALTHLQKEAPEIGKAFNLDFGLDDSSNL